MGNKKTWVHFKPSLRLALCLGSFLFACTKPNTPTLPIAASNEEIGNEQTVRALMPAPASAPVSAHLSAPAKPEPQLRTLSTYPAAFFKNIGCANSQSSGFEAAYNAKANRLAKELNLDFEGSNSASANSIQETWRNLRTEIFKSLSKLNTHDREEDGLPATDPELQNLPGATINPQSCIVLGEYFATLNYLQYFALKSGTQICTVVQPARWAWFGFSLGCNLATVSIPAFREARIGPSCGSEYANSCSATLKERLAEANWENCGGSSLTEQDKRHFDVAFCRSPLLAP